MTVVKKILIIAIGIACILAGCAKKPKQPLSDANIPSVSVPAKTDSGDIFNEFYNDSAVALDKVKSIKTFTLKPAKTTAKATTPATENTPGDSYTPSFSDNGRFVVQVASMSSRWLADELAAQFKEKGYPSYVLEVQNPTVNLPGTYYRVRIGGFATSVDAKAFAENVLVPAHFDYWVDRKANESSSPLESQLNQSQSSYTPSTYTPPAPASTPPPSSYESTIVPGPGTVPPSPPDQTPAPSSTGGWNDSSAKW